MSQKKIPIMLKECIKFIEECKRDIFYFNKENHKTTISKERIKDKYLLWIDDLVKFMNIQDDIFEEFFNNLEKDENIPEKLINGLKKLKEQGNIKSQKKILELIKSLDKNDSKN